MQVSLCHPRSSDLCNRDGNAGIDLVGEVYGFGLLANKQYAGQLLSPFTRYRTIAALDLAENCAEGVACGVL
jgi:hypothetical protein